MGAQMPLLRAVDIAKFGRERQYQRQEAVSWWMPVQLLSCRCNFNFEL
jgi:hypothetical protein